MELKQACRSHVITHSRNALAPSYLNTVPFFTNFLLLNSDANLQSVLLGHDYSPTGFSTRDLVFFDTRFQRALGLRPSPIRSPTRASSSRNTNRAQHTTARRTYTHRTPPARTALASCCLCLGEPFEGCQPTANPSTVRVSSASAERRCIPPQGTNTAERHRIASQIDPDHKIKISLNHAYRNTKPILTITLASLTQSTQPKLRQTDSLSPTRRREAFLR